MFVREVLQICKSFWNLDKRTEVLLVAFRPAQWDDQEAKVGLQVAIGTRANARRSDPGAEVVREIGAAPLAAAQGGTDLDRGPEIAVRTEDAGEKMRMRHYN